VIARRPGLLGSIAALAMLPFALFAQQSTPPKRFTLTGALGDRRLAEASGAAPSEANPGIFWTVGDSGNPPQLLAIDTTGALRGRVTLANAANVDWEAVAVGPCHDDTCVYVGDVGDNAERRAEVTIYRIREPRLQGSSVSTVAGMETLRLRYPHQAHDVEAIVVTPQAELLLITKGRSNGVLVYRVDSASWGRAGTVVAERVDSLPIVPHTGTGRLVTDAAIDASGEHVVVRTYRDLFIFRRTAAGKLELLRSCDILGREPQGEGVAWLPDGRLFLVSERGLFQRGTVHIVEC
jgi:hypothetical protein